MASSSISSVSLPSFCSLSRSCSKGRTPREVSDLISSCRFFSQLAIYGVDRMRNGRPDAMVVTMVSSNPDSTTLKAVTPQVSRFDSLRAERQVSTHWLLAVSGAPDSSAGMNLVPTQTPVAPSMRAAARLRPSKTPPAATSCTGSPVSRELYCLQMSAQAGIKMLPQKQGQKRDQC